MAATVENLKTHFLLIAFALIVVRAFYRRYVSPLRQVPGPLLASCSRLWKGVPPAPSQLPADNLLQSGARTPVTRSWTTLPCIKSTALW